MSEIALTVKQANRSGGADFTTNKTAAVSTNTYTFPNDGRTLLHVNSTAGSTVTVVSTATLDGLALADLALTATAAKQLTFGPFPPEVYGSTVTLSVSANSDIMAMSL